MQLSTLFLFQEGGVSERMHRHLRPGDLTRVTIGGDFTLSERLKAAPDTNTKILLLSAGIGVTPMIGALRWLRQRDAKRCSKASAPDRFAPK